MFGRRKAALPQRIIKQLEGLCGRLPPSLWFTYPKGEAGFSNPRWGRKTPMHCACQSLGWPDCPDNQTIPCVTAFALFHAAGRALIYKITSPLDACGSLQGNLHIRRGIALRINLNQYPARCRRLTNLASRSACPERNRPAACRCLLNRAKHRFRSDCPCSGPRSACRRLPPPLIMLLPSFREIVALKSPPMTF